MSDYMPEEMLRKKRLEINLTKDETKEAKELSYQDAKRYEEMKAKEKLTALIFDRTRSHDNNAVLPSPSFKARVEFESLRKENIEKGKSITDEATPFTFEIYDQIHSVDDLLSRDYIAINGMPVGTLIGKLKSVRFTHEMLLPSVIRANFKTYMTLAREWECYRDMEKKEGQSLPDALEKLYRIFYRRMSLYCRMNRINLDGTPMKTGEKIQNAEDITRDEAETFSMLAKETEDVKSKTETGGPGLTPIHFEGNELKNAEKEPSAEDKPKEEDPLAFIAKFKKMTPKERALSAPSMKQFDKNLKEMIRTTADPGQKALLQKSELLLSGWINYTDLQMELSKDPNNKTIISRCVKRFISFIF
ncbi:MAG: hypothetical protein ILP08_06365, partial [Lachnospiraceae bacterium]|nr:hypothetical protein [Lachnospiraceae bacterium]